jgi:hypothetical protein
LSNWKDITPSLLARRHFDLRQADGARFEVRFARHIAQKARATHPAKKTGSFCGPMNILARK